MAGKSEKVFVSGYVMWAKIVGERALVSNYEGDGREWSVDLYPDDISFLKEHKLLDRLKTDNEGNDFIKLKKAEFNKDGDPNEPFRIYNSNDEPWDDQLIGNGSKVDAKLDIRDWGVGKKKSIYLTALRVTDHVPYTTNEFAGMDKGKVKPAPETKAKAKTERKNVVEHLDADLDDEVPFD